MELSGHSDMPIVVNSSLQTVSSNVFQIRVSLQQLSWLITHQCRNYPRTPRDHGYAFYSQGMYTQTLALLQIIHVRCVLTMSQVVGWAICTIVVLVGYIQSVQTEYRRIKDWVGSSPPTTLPQPQQRLLPSIPTQAEDSFLNLCFDTAF